MLPVARAIGGVASKAAIVLCCVVAMYDRIVAFTGILYRIYICEPNAEETVHKINANTIYANTFMLTRSLNACMHRVARVPGVRVFVLLIQLR